MIISCTAAQSNDQLPFSTCVGTNVARTCDRRGTKILKIMFALRFWGLYEDFWTIEQPGAISLSFKVAELGLEQRLLVR